MAKTVAAAKVVKRTKVPYVKKIDLVADPIPPWVRLDKALLEKFKKINADFSKKFVDLQNKKIDKINALK